MCAGACVCMYALRIVSPGKILHCINTLSIIIITERISHLRSSAHARNTDDPMAGVSEAEAVTEKDI